MTFEKSQVGVETKVPHCRIIKVGAVKDLRSGTVKLIGSRSDERVLALQDWKICVVDAGWIAARSRQIQHGGKIGCLGRADGESDKHGG